MQPVVKLGLISVVVAGSTTRRLHKLLGSKSKVVGLDISEQLLNLARIVETNELLEFVQADAQSFSFEQQED